MAQKNCWDECDQAESLKNSSEVLGNSAVVAGSNKASHNRHFASLVRACSAVLEAEFGWVSVSLCQNFAAAEEEAEAANSSEDSEQIFDGMVLDLSKWCIWCCGQQKMGDQSLGQPSFPTLLVTSPLLDDQSHP